jgi:hypothetical protein
VAVVKPETVKGLVDSAKKAETSGKPTVVEFKVDAAAGAKSTQLSIPRSGFDELADIANVEVKVNVQFGTITFDSEAIQSISSDATAGDISFIISKSSLTEEGKQVLGDRPVYDLNVFAGEKNITTFGGSKIKVSIPYTLQAGEDPSSVIIYYVTDEGGLETVRGQYRAETGTVDFSTTHFSQYIVGYNKVAFADVAGSAWYHQAVGYLAARSITTGTDETHFSPNSAVTRGQFVVLLLNAYGIKAEAAGADNYSDAGNAYYTNYLAAAKRLGIANGVGDNQFEPNKEITRQELFTLLHRSLEVLGEIPAVQTGATVESFSDAGQIAGYSKDAFKVLVESGVITGNDSKLNPQGVSTRAQVAQVLYNLLSK